MTLSQDEITIIATQAAANYVKNQTSLTDSLVKSAETHDMNAEQIKRAVEATNQVTYLSLLKSAKDRTFEFPVTSYEDVRDTMLSAPDLEKSASHTPRKDVFDIFKDDAPLEKTASEKDLSKVDYDTFTDHEKVAMVWREFQKGEGELQKMAAQAEDDIQRIAVTGKRFQKDPQHIEKLSHVVEDENHFKRLARFLGDDGTLQKKAESSYAVFRDSDLNEARSISDQYHSLLHLHEKMAKTRDSLVRAGDFLVREKKASFNPAKRLLGAAASGTGKASGKTLGGLSAAAVGAPIGAAYLGVKGAKKMFGKKGPFEASDLLGPIGLQSDNGVWSSLHK